MAIDPLFNFFATRWGLSDRLRAYWFSALMTAAKTVNQVAVQQVADIAAAEEVIHFPAYDLEYDAIFGGAYPVPDFWLLRFPGRLEPTKKRYLHCSRGTLTFREWNANLTQFLPESEPAPGTIGRAATYFVGAARGQYNERIDAYIESQGAFPQVEYWATCGMSLGGAISSLIASNYPIKKQGGIYIPIPVPARFGHDQGAPRALNAAAAANQDDTKRRRVVNVGDPVPHVPPRLAESLFFPAPLTLVFTLSDYVHWGYRLALYANGAHQLGISRELDFEQFIFDPVANPFAPVTGPPEGLAVLQNINIAAHDEAEYARRIRASIPIPFPAPANLTVLEGLYELDQWFLSHLPNYAPPAPNVHPLFSTWLGGGGSSTWHPEVC